jgi:hypothetical protein
MGCMAMIDVTYVEDTGTKRCTDLVYATVPTDGKPVQITKTERYDAQSRPHEGEAPLASRRLAVSCQVPLSGSLDPVMEGHRNREADEERGRCWQET